MKRMIACLLAAVFAGSAAAPAPVEKRQLPLPDVTIYHLEGRRSERIVWLMEELRLPYKLEFKRVEAVVQFADQFLAAYPWFGGAEFSAADIMMKFPLDVATSLNLVDTAQFPNVAAWKKKIEARPAYQQMLAEARPDGLIGELPPLPQHAPPGPRATLTIPK